MDAALHTAGASTSLGGPTSSGNAASGENETTFDVCRRASERRVGSPASRRSGTRFDAGRLSEFIIDHYGDSARPS